MRFCFVSIFTMALVGFSSLAFAQEREWTLDATNEDAFLVFGVPTTDDVGVSFWCNIGSGKLKIFLPDGSPDLKPNTTTPFSMRIAGHDYALTGRTTANEMDGTTSIETEMAIDHDAIAALQSADRFSIKVVKHVSTYPLIDADLAGLLKLCRPR